MADRLFHPLLHNHLYLPWSPMHLLFSGLAATFVLGMDSRCSLKQRVQDCLIHGAHKKHFQAPYLGNSSRIIIFAPDRAVGKPVMWGLFPLYRWGD